MTLFPFMKYCDAYNLLLLYTGCTYATVPGLSPFLAFEMVAG